MEFQYKPGSFSLFRNTKKLAGDRLPDYKGEGKDTDGNDIEVAAWIRDGAKGKFMSCTMKPKAATQPPAKVPPMPSDDSDIPF